MVPGHAKDILKEKSENYMVTGLTICTLDIQLTNFMEQSLAEKLIFT